MKSMRLPDEQAFTSRLRSPAVAARVGVWLGACFALAFVTGLVSHEAHLAHPLVPLPTRPVWFYRVTQGVHVASGTAAIPLLLVKLWTVYPKLFARPPRAVRQLAVEGLERASIAVLVGSALFQLGSGVANTAQWYPWGFHFRATHYAMAWVAIGALVLHVAVKLPLVADVLRQPTESGDHDRPGTATAAPVSRRALVRSTLLASGVAVIATAGSAVPWLRPLSVFGVRSGRAPGGIPINKSATAADVVATALSPAYRLVVNDGSAELSFSRADLERLRQRTHDLPIACVEGWSASGRWSGVRLRDLLDLLGAPRGRDLRVTSLQPRGPYRITTLPARFADDQLTLIALGLEGEALSLDHGYPCRLIAPDRPGVFQTKWLSRLEVL